MDTLPDTAPEPPKEPPKKSPRGRRIVAFVLLFAAALGLGVGLGHRPLVRFWIEKEARARGIELTFDDFNPKWGRVVLTGAKAKLEGVTGLAVEAPWVAVDLAGLSPTRLEARNVVVTLATPLDERLEALAAFDRRHPGALDLPATANATVYWGSKESPWIVLAGQATKGRGDEGAFEGTVAFEGTNLGLVGARWNGKDPASIWLGAKTPEAAPLRLALDTKAKPMRLSATLPPTKVDDLARARSLSVPADLRGASVEGTVAVTFGGPESKGMYAGTASLEVKGWVPPHPKELDGIVFGNKTKLGATFEITPNLVDMRISKATVDAGAFKLAGPGTVKREGLSARVKMTLDGAVPCSELGASAVGAHVDGLIGDLLKGVARVGLGGSVKVRVTVDADTRKIERATVDQAVTVGCGLR
ncbi:hypothetical protein [Polyangium jinanense]|uniref:Uncharacterized protein n=1 Tax=Polyangium jinanense TaxID=2829994 RepID=A0A9X3XBE7_9BACT|nr:hypothetical protein [Polyangium jinanense]MDC3960225.1 hypothetical protein [Polyangium jinanense]MDC3984941.1 hypothetical protein [Polyangium jinanense]